MNPIQEWAHRRRRKTLGRVAIVLAMLPLSLLLFEGGTRAWLAWKGEPYDGAATRRAYERALESAVRFVPTPRADLPIDEPEDDLQTRVLHPFMGFDLQRGLKQIDDYLLEERHGRLDDRVDILILGGSVAQIFGQFGEAKLRARLEQDRRFAGRTIRLIKLGRGGYKQPQQALFLVYLLALGFEPEIVVNIDGFNEVALGNNNAIHGTHPIFPSLPHWGHLAMDVANDDEALDLVLLLRTNQRELKERAVRALERGEARSAILGRRALAGIRELERERVALVEQYTAHLASANRDSVLRGPTEVLEMNRPAWSCVRAWMRSSEAMHAMCAARGIHFVHVLQPTLHDEGSKPASEEELRVGAIDPNWKAGVVDGYPLLRKASARLQAQGIAFLDASSLFVGVEKTLYFDACHFGQEGNDMLADAIATTLLRTYPD